MRETLVRLIELARLDDEMAALEAEERGIPERLAELEAQARALAERVAAVEQEIAAAESRQRRLESDLADAEVLRARLDQQQYEVTSRDAYQALLHEMQATRERISTRESEILECMEQLDAQRAEQAELEARVAEEQARLEAARQGLEARSEALRKEIGRVAGARRELCAGIDPQSLERYARVAAHRRPAAVAVAGETCPACQVEIPPLAVLQLLAGDALVSCATCHRLLVHARLVG